MSILANHQAKLSHLGHRKPARIHWKADALKTSLCLVRILVLRYNWAIFLRKWARRSHYSQWRTLSGHVERLFVHKNWRGGYWQHLVSASRRYVPQSRSYARWSHYQPQSCDLTPLDCCLWSAVIDKRYAGKPETIHALKDNIREAIREIQLYTIDNVLKNWNDLVGYCMANRVSHFNEIIFHYLPEGLYFQIKKEIWENIQY